MLHTSYFDDLPIRDGGQVPELAKARNVSFIDIESGHWPMITAPTELARMLSQAGQET